MARVHFIGGVPIRKRVPHSLRSNMAHVYSPLKRALALKTISTQKGKDNDKSIGNVPQYP